MKAEPQGQNSTLNPKPTFGAWRSCALGRPTELHGYVHGLRLSFIPAWMVGGLSKGLFYGVISTLTPIRIPLRARISVLITYLLSRPTLQVGIPKPLRRMVKGS